MHCREKAAAVSVTAREWGKVVSGEWVWVWQGLTVLVRRRVCAWMSLEQEHQSRGAGKQQVRF